MSGLLLVLSGPSGVGKGTVAELLLQRNPNMRFSVSCTTRAIRSNDIEGVTYFFKTEEEFTRMIEEDGFLEHAGVYGKRYGTPRAFVNQTLQSGQDCLLDIDPQGALQVMSKHPGAVSIFLLPPSLAELRRRLIGRQTESAEAAEKRFSQARSELEMAPHYDYVVTNTTVQETAETIERILAAERCRVSRAEAVLTQLKEEVL